MNTKSNNQNVHDHNVGTYFDKAAVSFDTFYDHKRNAFMQWVDRKFRSDVFQRYYMTFETLEPMQNKSVLDIGCGSGPYITETARRGAKLIIGLDMAQTMLDLAKKRTEAAGTEDKCEFILGTFPKNSPQKECDYAIVMGVMDYIADPGNFLKALAQNITERAVLSFPSKHWFRTPFRKFRYWIKKCPVYFYEPTQIQAISKAAGFSDCNIKKMPGAGMDYFVTCFKK
jgi:cyclopropane fatty-acyl-phospholipid synthase-like methyltransferase